MIYNAFIFSLLSILFRSSYYTGNKPISLSLGHNVELRLSAKLGRIASAALCGGDRAATLHE
jgi:hypothetical protein